MSITPLEPCCLPSELAGRSIADLFLEIQNYTAINEKSLDWVDHIECLSVSSASEDGKTLILKSIYDDTCNDSDELRDFVAVSYSCEAMLEFERDDDSPTFRIKRSNGDLSYRNNRTRDLVIQRVVRYAKLVQCPRFWISEDCVDQGNDQKVKTAMNSMDLVYGDSKHPLGLMSTILQTEEEICLLWMLLKGNLASPSGINPKIDRRLIDQTVLLLELLSRDRWWKRAWTYQEEYVGNTMMTIMIRHAPELEAVKKKAFKGDDLGIIRGEILFNVSSFRKKVTIFLHSLRSRESETEKSRCTDLIDYFGKYNVLYQLEDTGKRKPMSSRVIADISRRDIGKKYDRLPVVANSCNYPLRFDPQVMSSLPYSVNVLILAMFARNGEIIANDKDNMMLPTQMSIGEFLHQIAFAGIRPPRGVKELSWLKNCRLPRPKLVASGTETEGYLWSVKVEVSTCNWKSTSRLGKFSRSRLTAKKLGCLAVLIKILRWRKGCARLVDELKKYLAERKSGKRRSQAERYKDLMANEVCNAILGRQPLFLAAPSGSDSIKAIFVGLSKRDTQMFTAWSYGKEEDERLRTRHVSLSVRIEGEMGENDVPHLKIQTWANGLVFFRTCERRRMVVSWPKAFLQTFPQGDGLPGPEAG